MSIFGAPAAAPSNVLLQMKAGKLVQQGTSVTSDPRKGLLTLRKSEDGLMHLLWKDRASGTVEDDLIVFQGDAAMEHVPQCSSGFAMMLRFTTGRKALFWSQEPRKKGAGWEDISKERDLVKKANDILNGTPAPPAAAAPSGARIRVPTLKQPCPPCEPTLTAPLALRCSWLRRDDALGAHGHVVRWAWGRGRSACSGRCCRTDRCRPRCCGSCSRRRAGPIGGSAIGRLLCRLHCQHSERHSGSRAADCRADRRAGECSGRTRLLRRRDS
jgi:hypothetical protein